MSDRELIKPTFQVAILFGWGSLPRMDQMMPFLEHFKQEIAGIRPTKNAYVLLCKTEDSLERRKSQGQ
jgi:hypothetical protein